MDHSQHEKTTEYKAGGLSLIGAGVLAQPV